MILGTNPLFEVQYDINSYGAWIRTGGRKADEITVWINDRLGKAKKTNYYAARDPNAPKDMVEHPSWFIQALLQKKAWENNKIKGDKTDKQYVVNGVRRWPRS